MTSMEITRKGYVRSDAELAGIRRKKVEFRQKQHRATLRAHHESRKERDVIIRRQRDDPEWEPAPKKVITSTHEFRNEVFAAMERERMFRAAAKEAEEEAKEAKMLFRKAKNRRKQHKKKQKRERRKQKKKAASKAAKKKTRTLTVQTESDILTYSVKGNSKQQELFRANREKYQRSLEERNKIEFIASQIADSRDRSLQFNYGKNLDLSSSLKELVPDVGELSFLLEMFKNSILEYRDVIAVVLYVHQMCCSKSFAMDMSLTASFAINEANKSALVIFGSSACIFNALSRRHDKKNLIQAEAFSDVIEGIADNGSMLLSSSFVTSLTKIVLIVTSWKLFSRDIARDIHKVCGHLEKEYSVPEAVSAILKSVASLIRVGESLMNGCSISDALFSNDPFREALLKSDHLLKYKDALYYGLPSGDRMCAKLFMSDTRPLYEFLTLKMRGLNPFAPDYSRVSSTVSCLMKARADVSMKLERKIRTPPIGIVIHGSPGTGKSTVTDFVCQLHSHIKGRVFDQTHVFNRVMTSQYWDGYDPYSTPYIHYSEVGAVAESIIRNKGDDVVKELTSVVDALPLVCDMSSVTDKGTICCLPEMVLIDTNVPDLGLPLTVKNEAAYKRRFIYIEVAVKKEHRLNGTAALDPNSEGEFYDKWIFNVITYIPTGIKSTDVVNHLQNGDIYALERTLAKLFSERIKRDQNVLSRGQTPFPFTYDPNDMSEEKNEEEEKSYSPYSEDDSESDVDSVPEPLTVDYDRQHRLTAFATEADVVIGAAAMRPFVNKTCILLYALFLNALQVAFDSCVFAKDTIEFLLLSFRFSDVFCYRSFALVITIILIVAHWFNVFPYVLIVLIHAMLSVDFFRIAKNSASNSLTTGHLKCKRSLMRIKGQCYSTYRYILGDSSSTVCVRLIAISSIVGAASFLVLGFWGWRSKRKTRREERKNIKSESSKFVDTSNEVTEQLAKIEDEYKCGESYVRIPIKGTTQWNVQNVNPSPHKSGPLSLHNGLMRNSRRVYISSGDTVLRTFCFGVCRNYALINFHSFGEFKGSVVLKVSTQGGFNDNPNYHATTVTSQNMAKVCPDIYLVDLSGVAFKDVMKHFPVKDTMFRNADGYIAGDKVVVERFKNSLSAADSVCGQVDYGPVVKYKWLSHRKGHCGLPVVAQRDSGSCIVGLHCAGGLDGSDSYAAVITRGDISTAMNELQRKNLAHIGSEATILCGSQPHMKSPVRYEELGSIEYFGSVSSPNMNQKSSLRTSMFRKDLPELFYNVLGHFRETVYTKPLMKPTGSGVAFRSPYNVAIRKMSKCKKPLVRVRVCKAVDIIVDKVMSNLEKHNIPRLSPLTVEVAVNGAAKDPFIRRLDMTKAAGYGTSGKKSDHAVRYHNLEGYTSTYDEISPEIQAEIIHIISCYRQGQNYGPVYKAQLKDEPRDVEKVAVGKTRVFFATPFAYLVVQRMFLSPFFSLMLQFNDSFYTAIGIDMHRGADVLYKRLIGFSDKILEGDYGGYDQSMPFDIGRGANTIVLRIVELLGYTPEQLQIVAGLLSDNLFPMVEMIGEMMSIPGLQPSGKYATAEDNSIRNLLIMVYMWLSNDKTHDKDFFEYVLPVSYGDDVLASVKAEVSNNFNALIFSNMCEELTDLTFTTSGKGEISEEFVTPERMSFLKRNFREHSQLQKIAAPLSLDSLYKTLEWVSPSTSINPPSQYEMIVNSVLRELYLHDRPLAFDAFRSYFTKKLYSAYPEMTFDLVTASEIFDSLQTCPPH